MFDFHSQLSIIPEVYETASLTDNLEHSGGITIAWNSASSEEIPLGAYVEYGGLRFILLEPYAPVKSSFVHYRYEPTFKHPAALLDRIPFWITSRDAEQHVIHLRTTSFTGYPDVIAQKVVDFFAEYASTMGDTYFAETIGTSWSYDMKGVTFEKAIITVSFDGCSIRQAINAIADAIGCNVFLNFSSRTVRFISGTTIEGEYYNCYHVLGGTTNMGKVTTDGSYAAVTQRLTLKDELPDIKDSIIDRRQGGTGIRLTKDLIFDDVYPRMELYISSARQRLCWLTDENGSKIETTSTDKCGKLYPDGKYYKTFAKWYIKLTVDSAGQVPYVFDPTKLINDKPLTILFQPNYEDMEHTSTLVGKQFELTYFVMDTPEWEENDVLPRSNYFVALAGEYRIAFVAEGETILPTTGAYKDTPEGPVVVVGEGLVPQVGNKVSLVNMALGTQEKESAQAELKAAALEVIDLMEAPRAEYTETMFSNIPLVGDVSPFAGHGGVVVSVNRNIDTDVSEVTVGSWAHKGLLSGMTDKIDTVSVTQAEATTNDNTKMSADEFNKLLQTQVKSGTLYVADLDNESDAIPCTYDGKAEMNKDIFTEMMAFYGTKDVLEECTFLLSAIPSGATIYQESSRTATVQTALSAGVSYPVMVNSVLKPVLRVHFTQGNDVAEHTDIEIILTHPTYGERSVVFTILGIRAGEEGGSAVIYQLKPSERAVNVGRTAAGGYNPSAVSVKCGYTKSVGESIEAHEEATTTIDDKYRVFFCLHHRGGNWDATYYFYGSSSQDKPNLASLNVTDFDKVRFILYQDTTHDTLTVIDTTKVFDNEDISIIADGVDGQNAVRVDLDNENDSMLYDGNGTLLSGSVVSHAHLYDGAQDVSSQTTWTVTSSKTGNVDDCTISSGNSRNITITGMTADTAQVTVQGQYSKQGISYARSSVLSLKKIVGADKYDIVVTPNAVPYNTSETWTQKNIAITANRRDSQGTKTEGIALNNGVYVAAKYKTTASGTASWHQVGQTGRTDVVEVTLTLQEDIVQNNENILFELRKATGTYNVDNPNSYTVEDYETVPVNKAKNGENSVRIDLDNQGDMLSVGSDMKSAYQRTIVTHARIYDGASSPASGVTLTDTIANLQTALTIGDCVPTVAFGSDCVLTITWVFTTSTTAADVPKTISLIYGGKTYSAVFTLATTRAQEIWQVVPDPSKVSFTRSGNALTPPSQTLYCGYIKYNGRTTQKVEHATTTGGQIGTTGKYIFYRYKSNGVWSSWISYQNALSLDNDTTVQDFEFCISDGGTIANDESNILDREVVPVVKDGLNGDGDDAVVMSLDSTSGIIKYQGDGTTKIDANSSVSATVTLTEGNSDISSGKTFSVDTDNTSSSVNYTFSGRVLTVTGITSDSGHVTIQCTYGNTTYKVKYTVQRVIIPDEWSLDITPDTLTLNTSEGWSTSKTVTIKVMRTPSGGTPAAVNPSSYGLDLAANVGSLGTYTSSGFVLTITQEQARTNDHSDIILYKHQEASKVYASGTVTLQKTANGTSPWIADLDNEMDSVACDTNGSVTTKQRVTTTAKLWYGSERDTNAVISVSEGSRQWTNNEVNENVKIFWDNDTGVVTIEFRANSSFSNAKREFTITLSNGTVNKSQIFTVNGLRAAGKGDNAVIFSLVPSINEIIKKKNNGGYIPAGTDYVTCAVKKTDGSSVTTVTSGFVLKYILNNDGEERTDYTDTKIQVQSVTVNVVFLLYVGGVLVDRETVPLINEGDKGDNAVSYELKPAPESINVARTDSGGYVPSRFSIRCGYVKNDGGEMITVADARDLIDSKYRIYYRKKQRNASQETWETNYILYENSSTQGLDQNVSEYDAVEFVMCSKNTSGSFPSTVSASDMNSTSQGHAYDVIDRAVVSILADGMKGDTIWECNAYGRFATAPSQLPSVTTGITESTTDFGNGWTKEILNEGLEFIESRNGGAWSASTNSAYPASDGWRESKNNQHSAFVRERIHFNTSSVNQTVVIQIATTATEKAWDGVIVGELDTNKSAGTCNSNRSTSTYNYDSANPIVSISVSVAEVGSHYIDIVSERDSSGGKVCNGYYRIYSGITLRKLYLTKASIKNGSVEGSWQPAVEYGNNGNEGPSGPDGDDAWSIDSSVGDSISLSQAISVSSDTSRQLREDFGLPLDITFSAKNGNNAATISSISITASGEGYSGVSVNNDTTNKKLIINKVTRGATSGFIKCTVTATYNGQTFSKFFHITIGITWQGEIYVGLEEVGIHITGNDKKITAIGDKFEWKDSNDNVMLGMSNGMAEFSGTVKAKNFFHNVLIHGSESNTGDADIVVIKSTQNDTYDITIILPNADASTEGKIVEIIDTRYSNNYTIGRLVVRQVDNTVNNMKYDFYQVLSIGNELTLDAGNKKYGGQYRLLAYKEGNVYYWVELKNYATKAYYAEYAGQLATP